MYAQTNPYYEANRAISTQILPGLPAAINPISEKDGEPPSVLRTYSNKLMQKSVKQSAETRAIAEKPYPPVVKFVGKYKIPLQTNPLKRVNPVANGPISSISSISFALIILRLVLGVYPTISGSSSSPSESLAGSANLFESMYSCTLTSDLLRGSFLDGGSPIAFGVSITNSTCPSIPESFTVYAGTVSRAWIRFNGS